MKFNWGTGITITLIVMVCGILALVFITTRKDYFLVESDYYQKGINYQERIDRINNVNSLLEKPQFTITNQTLTIQFPAWFQNKTIEGQILLYSPVDEKLDKKTFVQLDQSLSQAISLQRISPGRYILKVEWKADNTPYYWEQQITIE